MGYIEDKQLHDSIDMIGLRAQATSIGLIQLAVELRRAGVLEDAAIGRIKEAIAREIVLNAPKSISKELYLATVHKRLDHLFAGEEGVGPARREVFAPHG
jgi:hypothetical protein